MGRPNAAIVTWLLSILATALLVVVHWRIADSTYDSAPRLPFGFLLMAVAWLVARVLQGQQLQDHQDVGGIVASDGKAAGIGLLCLLCVVGSACALEALEQVYHESRHGERFAFGDDDIYVLGTGVDPNHLASLLTEAGIFGGDGVSVRVVSESGVTRVGFCVAQDAWDDPRTILGFQILGAHLTQAGLPASLRIELCDDQFNPQHSSTVIAVGQDIVCYGGAATEEQARQLAAALSAAGSFTNQGGFVVLEIGPEGLAKLSFVLELDGPDWTDSELVREFQLLGNDLIVSGLPAPLTIVLKDESFEPRQTVKIEEATYFAGL
jgi:hypothetical protein